MRFRGRYWSGSRLADIIRGTVKPRQALTPKDWREWRIEARKKHCIRYWVAETLLNRIQDTVWYIPDRIHDIHAWYRNRFVTQTHLLRADSGSINPGEWREFGSRILPCVFDSFTRWVETDLGLRYLEWAQELRFDESWGVNSDDPRFGTLTPQAEDAREIYVLYWWWTSERPARIDADADAVAFYDRLTQKYPDVGVLEYSEVMTDDEKAQQREVWDSQDRLTKSQEDEDTAMLVRLVTMRERLWT